ncbi:ABC transporter substrate-binding protein [Alicyclobacillus herbarius]|uniref:ABC transporter substrate-binding protein n=1 Tax=Alicyclobacillus herbarius TaxID=122960 RepID=UPI002352297F|nr:sugar ABC transporter substrate-binding protein [Alicyclobacillus herbarius]
MKRIAKIGILAGVSVMLMGSVAACGSSTSNSGSSSGNGKVTLTYMLWDPNEEVGYKKSIAEFEKKHPNIQVNIEQYPWAQYWQKLQTEMAAGTAPDVFWDHVTYFPTFVKNGQLLDLSPYIKQDHVDTSIYYPQLLKQYQYNGGTYGLPKDWDTIAIFYNKDMFKKEGVPAPTNLTWNPTDGGSLVKVAEKMTIDNNGKHPGDPGFDPNHVKQYGFMAYNSNQSFYYNFMAENGAKIINKQFGNKLLFDSPQGIQAMQGIMDMINKYHISPPGAEGTNANGNANAQKLFEQGKLAMYMDGDWNLTPVVSSCKFHVGVALLPIGPQGRVSVMNGLSDAIYAHTKHPKEAWELEKWLASPQSERILASGGYVWPGIQKLAPLFADSWQKRGVDVTPFLEESKGKTISFPITFNWGQADTAINKEFDLMWLGKVSPSEAVKTAVQQANAALQGNQ